MRIRYSNLVQDLDGSVRHWQENTARGLSRSALETAIHSGTARSLVYTSVLMTHHVTGPFTVKLEPQAPDNDAARSANLGRLSIDKRFHGDLEAASKGEMLSAVTEVKGSAGYVAIERVTGTLGGRAGSFVLQHNAIMQRGVPQLAIVVIPDSGTDQLTGLAGTMTIRIEGGQHFYEFDYTLPVV